MRIMRLLIALTAFCLPSNCAHVTPVVVDCAQETASGLLPTVESALMEDSYVSELTKLVVRYGECVIRKAVVIVTGKARGDMQMFSLIMDTDAQVRYEHGSNWLAAHPER